MSWLKEHLETFVKPVLGEIPSSGEVQSFLSEPEMAVIKNAWRSVKRFAKDKKILLPGRDVWIFEVLARRENYPTWFIPQCSRLAIDNFEIPDIEKYLVVDTGFMGSIPTKLGTQNFMLLSYKARGDFRQIFPNRTGSRSLALKIEYLPKYWKTGFSREGLIGQEFSDSEEFRRAAILTQQIYKDSSRKR